MAGIKEEFDAKSLQDMLKIYYVRLFPHKPFYRWLSYNLCEYFLAPKKTLKIKYY